MICTKCRKKFPNNISVCPDCGNELIREMGSADAPKNDADISLDENVIDIPLFRVEEAEGDSVYLDFNSEDEKTEFDSIDDELDVDAQQDEEYFEEEKEIQFSEPENEEKFDGEEIVFSEKPKKSTVHDDYSPVVYTPNAKNSANSQKKVKPVPSKKKGSGVLSAVIFVIAFIFLALSAVFFYKGNALKKTQLNSVNTSVQIVNVLIQ